MAGDRDGDWQARGGRQGQKAFVLEDGTLGKWLSDGETLEGLGQEILPDPEEGDDWGSRLRILAHTRWTMGHRRWL